MNTLSDSGARAHAATNGLTRSLARAAPSGAVLVLAVVAPVLLEDNFFLRTAVFIAAGVPYVIPQGGLTHLNFTLVDNIVRAILLGTAGVVVALSAQGGAGASVVMALLLAGASFGFRRASLLRSARTTTGVVYVSSYLVIIVVATLSADLQWASVFGASVMYWIALIVAAAIYEYFRTSLQRRELS